DRAVRAEQDATEAETHLTSVRKLYEQRTKDLLIGKWKTTFPEKDKVKVTEFTYGGQVITTMPDEGTGMYRWIGADQLDIQMKNPRTPRGQLKILTLTWHQLILVGPDGKEWKAERK